MRALVALVLVAGCQPGIPPAATPGGPPVPPTVLNGEAALDCNIDAKKNGRQKLVMNGGAGIAFDAVVSPIVDGTVQLHGPEKGGVYKFTSHLAQPTRAKLSGVGDVALETLETKVSVEIGRYQQPDGPGTAFTFNADDMKRHDMYIEFAGTAKADNGDRFSFRVTLGESKSGNGRVQPTDSNDNSHIAAKMVVVYAPMTTVYVTTTTSVQRLP